MFKDVTGRSVLDEPHHDTDRAAYAIAREWFRFEPGYALGLATLKADRLFDPEHRLLYWSIFRPGVLVGRPAAWFAARRGAITGFADAFGLATAGLALVGFAAAVARRRWTPAGAGPVPARARRDVCDSSSPSPVTGCRSRCWRSRSWRSRSGRSSVSSGPRWRDRHRGWSTRRRLSRRRWCCSSSGASAGPRCWTPAPACARAIAGRSARPTSTDARACCSGRRRRRWPLSRRWPGHRKASASARTARGRPSALRLRLGGGPLPAGRYGLHFRLEAASGAARFTLAGAAADVSPGAPATLDADVTHPGGPLTLSATTSGSAGGSVWVGEATVKTLH